MDVSEQKGINFWVVCFYVVFRGELLAECRFVLKKVRFSKKKIKLQTE